MIDAQRFPFTERFDEFGTPDAVASVPLILTYRNIAFLTGMIYNILGFWARAVPNSEFTSECKRHCPGGGMGHGAIGRKLDVPHGYEHGYNSIEVSGLLDIGASINISPYDVGIRLGAVWEEQTISVLLAGNLAPVEARGLIVSTEICPFAPIRLVFAWSETDDVPLLLGA